MGRKSASKSSNSARHQPNAPELQQILEQQPPVNPYYPTLTNNNSAAAYQQPPPPPYSSSNSGPNPVTSSSAIYHSVPMSQLNQQSNNISYPRMDHGHGHTPVVIHTAGVTYDHRASRNRHKIRSFNNSTMIVAILTLLSALWAYNMYHERRCIESFVIHKPGKDLEVTIRDAHNLHMLIVNGSGLLFLLCLVRGCFGFSGKHFGCYLFLVSILTFGLTLLSGYLAWLAFWSPCPGSIENLVSGFSKTIVSKFADSLPSPDKSFFGESNVLALAKEDPKGLLTFTLDLASFISLLSVWLGSISAC